MKKMSDYHLIPLKNGSFIIYFLYKNQEEKVEISSSFFFF